jgi:uncharacterized ion transporter superfamily protein YfcC
MGQQVTPPQRRWWIALLVAFVAVLAAVAIAALAVPVLAPLADFANVRRGLVVTGFQSASGWMNLFTPTSAVVMGGLALAKVKYNRYLRFIAPLLGILLVLIMAFIAIGALIG